MLSVAVTARDWHQPPARDFGIGYWANCGSHLVSRIAPMAFGEPLMPRYARVAGRLDAGLAGGFGYVALTGFSIPTQRAVTLLAFVTAALILNCTAGPGYTLAVVVLAVLGWNAAAVSSVGFWLLFAAVAIIFYSLRGRFMPKHQGSQAFRLQWMLALGLAPLTLLFFQRLSLISPIANLNGVP